VRRQGEDQTRAREGSARRNDGGGGHDEKAVLTIEKLNFFDHRGSEPEKKGWNRRAERNLLLSKKRGRKCLKGRRRKRVDLIERATRRGEHPLFSIKKDFGRRVKRRINAKEEKTIILRKRVNEDNAGALWERRHSSSTNAQR